MRRVGYLLVIALTLLCVALHQRSRWRSQQLLAGEALATQRLEQIHRLASNALREDTRPQLPELLLEPQLSALVLLDTLARPGLAFAWDEVYVYGMAQTSVRYADTGKLGPGYVLRAWPRHFGTTGDLQLHIDSNGTYFHGQNNKGRSGVLIDFPPPFPDPDVGSRHAGWWPQKLASGQR
jgi:hypothetical protein